MNMQFDPRRGACVPRAWQRHACSALLCGGITLAAAGAWAQAISDVPLAVKNNVPPNLMFMIDKSGSMNNIVPGAPYDSAVVYEDLSCTVASQLSTAAQIDINISGSGVPRFRVSGTNYTHTTVTSGALQQRCFDNSLTYTARLLGNSGGSPVSYLAAQYTGHYLNWYFGNFNGPVTGWTDRKRVDSGAVETRLEVAKASAKSVIDGLPTSISGTASPAVRLGLSVYNSSDGGLLLIPMRNLVAPSTTTDNGSDIGSGPFKTSIDGIQAGGNTPLAETLADIGRYLSTGYNGNTVGVNNNSVSIDDFLRQDTRASCLAGTTCAVASPDGNTQFTLSRPIQYYCQRSFAFMMTDGRPQADQDFSNNTYLRDYDGDCSGTSCPDGFDKKPGGSYELQGSGYLDDVAKALFDIDLRPNLIPPSGAKEKPNNLVTYTISFADDQAKNDPLLQSAAQQGGGRFLTADNGPQLTQAFQAALADAFSKDASSAAVAVANTQITADGVGYASSYFSNGWFGDLEAFSLDSTTGLPVGAAQWSAQTKLDARTPSSRKIASFDGSSGRAFTAANFSGTPASLTPEVINFIRGDRSLEGTTTGGVSYRQRLHLLGDIVNAEPVAVKYPDGASIIFQAANDGMLHVLDGRTTASVPTRGEELWAYVPRLIHSNLSLLATTPYSHRFFVDGTPNTAEITGAGAMTRILVGGLGKGGNGYYALDITDYNAADEAAAAAKVRWEFTHANMGYSFGTPMIVKTAAGWRVLVTSGYDNGSALGGDGRGYVWVLDPATGAILATLATGVGSTSNPSGLAHLASLSNAATGSVTRFVYGGDLEGNVWRFDLDTSQVVKIATLTDGSGVAQPVTSAPAVGPVAAASTKFFVYVGTGRYLGDEDIPGNTPVNVWATQTQTMYGILDNTADASPSLPDIRGSNGSVCPAGGGSGNFVCQTLTFVSATKTYTATTHPVDVATKRGWYVDLPDANSRVTGMPALTPLGTLAFTANVPTNVACDPGGSSSFFGISGSNGGAVAKVIGGNTFFEAGVVLGNALASRPVIVVTSGGLRALVRMSDRTIKNPEVHESASLSAPWRRIYWRSLR